MQVPAFLAVLVLSFYPCVLRAQSTNASLTGRVTDPSKAAIAEARITAINTVRWSTEEEQGIDRQG